MMKQRHHLSPTLLGLVVSLLLMLAFAFPAAGGQQVRTAPDSALDRVVLRQNITVDSTLITLGDFFDGAGDKALISVAYAPEPGKRAVFDANWLYRAANAYGLKWRPLSLKQQAVVKRETVTIGREEIEDNILAALIDKGVDPEMTVQVSNRSLRLYAASRSLARVIVENLDFDPRTRRFSAFVSTPESKATRVTGRLQKMLNVPVTNRRVMSGELIRSEDIVWIKTPSERVQHDIVMYPDDLIGKTPKRGLRAGAPIRTSDVQRPIIVKKGSLVRMILRTPMMTLTSQGQAIDNGSDGDVIRLTNTQSKTIIQAVVSGPGLVSISSTSYLAMN
jgi:flagella basal body P-ring formation protein FlgA